MTALASLILERDFSQSPALAAVQEDAIDMATNETDLMLAKYNQHSETHGGRYVCADTFKEIFPAFENQGDRAKVNNAIHNSAAVLSSTQFREVLKRDEPERTKAVFVTGIPGSGKTTTVTNALMNDKVKVLFEGQLANPQSAFSKIEDCLAAGLKVTIAAVHIDAEKALDNTFKRFNGYGRGASIGIMAEIQGNLVKGLTEIKERFGEKVEFVGFDQNQKSRLMTDWQDICQTLSVGTKEEILETLAVKSHHDFSTGKISQACFDQAKGVTDVQALIERRSDQTDYSQSQVVVNSAGSLLQHKTDGIWRDVEKFPAEGMKAAVHPLANAKKAEVGKSYQGEIVHRDAVSVFQKTAQGLVRHSAYQLSNQVSIGQKCTIRHEAGKRPEVSQDVETRAVKRRL